MNKKQLFTAALALSMGASGMAQEKLFNGSSVQSPVKNADGTVTFNLYAPQARQVSVSGDFLPTMKMKTPKGEIDAPGSAQLTKNEQGVWSYTTAVLSPELYSYAFNVDGLNINDPANIYMNRDISTYSNIFIITKTKGDKGYLYSVNEVPHGNLAKVWYESPTLKMQRRMTIYTPAGYDKGLPRTLPPSRCRRRRKRVERAWTYVPNHGQSDCNRQSQADDRGDAER